MELVLRNPSRLSVLIAALFVAFYIFSNQYWKDPGKIIASDVVDYYGYLPAIFIFKDLGITKAETIDKGLFYARQAPNGRTIFKMTVGMSMVYLPFFTGGHFAAKWLGYETNGFSDPYRFALLMGALVYFMAGMLFLRKILLTWFSEKVTALTLLAVGIGTNLLYYASNEGSMSHVFSFALINLFIWHTIQWYKSPGHLRILWLGFLAGLITLIRPINIMVLLFFFLYDITSFKSILGRIKMVFNKFSSFLLMFVAFLVPWMPQFLYNIYFTDHLFFYSYIGERFFFNNPQIINGLFSYRKGWLLYTPMMVFALAGIPLLFSRLKEMAWPVTVFTILNIYIVFSWWCWWYGGSFGQRPMVDSYGLLAIPFALLIKGMLGRRKWLATGTIAIVFLLIAFNNFQIKKYEKGSIHFADMTKAAYWHSFWSVKPRSGFYDLLETPDYNLAPQGIYVIKPKEPKD